MFYWLCLSTPYYTLLYVWILKTRPFSLWCLMLCTTFFHPAHLFFALDEVFAVYTHSHPSCSQRQQNSCVEIILRSCQLFLRYEALSSIPEVLKWRSVKCIFLRTMSLLASWIFFVLCISAVNTQNIAFCPCNFSKKKFPVKASQIWFPQEETKQHFHLGFFGPLLQQILCSLIFRHRNDRYNYN